MSRPIISRGNFPRSRSALAVNTTLGHYVIAWADTPANHNGSPGLFGRASETEFFFDNVKITPQK